MQHISKWVRRAVVAAALVSLQAVVLAQGEGRFSGTVLDPSGAPPYLIALNAFLKT